MEWQWKEMEWNGMGQRMGPDWTTAPENGSPSHPNGIWKMDLNGRNTILPAAPLLVTLKRDALGRQGTHRQVLARRAPHRGRCMELAERRIERRAAGRRAQSDDRDTAVPAGSAGAGSGTDNVAVV